MRTATERHETDHAVCYKLHPEPVGPCEVLGLLHVVLSLGLTESYGVWRSDSINVRGRGTPKVGLTRCEYLKTARLVVSAVGARDKLAIGTTAREPALDVELLGSGEIEGTGDNVNDLVGQAQGLQKVF